MAHSIYDLTHEYINLFIERPIEKSEVKSIMNKINTLLTVGWTSQEIMLNMKFFKNKYHGVELDLNSYFRGRKPKARNILNSNKFYWHNQLRLIPPPVVVTVDYETGTITSKTEEYYLEMRASYTVDELYNYYISKDGLYEKQSLNESRMIGSINWLLTKYPIDLILFMIDVAHDLITSNDMRPLSTPMDVQSYIIEARDTLQRKITENKLSGDDKIVLRKRMLHNRNGSLDRSH